MDNKTNINWYPGHMEKTKRQIKETMPLVDYILELADSRIPYSSRVMDIKNIISGKPKILVMAKRDLSDIEETKKWITKYKDENPICVNLNDHNDIKILLNAINTIAADINKKRKEKGLKPKEIRGLVIGIPNVGKSTLINKIVGKKVAGVGNTPGFTKNLNWLRAGNSLLLDSPGILWPKFENKEVALNLASMSAIKTEILPVDEVAVHILKKLNDYYPNILKERYGLDALSEDYEYNYGVIAKKIGATKNGEIDYTKVSLFIINDIKNENIKGITFDRCI